MFHSVTMLLEHNSIIRVLQRVKTETTERTSVLQVLRLYPLQVSTERVEMITLQETTEQK